jgi:hypothetical protein
LAQIYFEIWIENSLEIGWQNSLEFLFCKKKRKDISFSLSFPSPFLAYSHFWPSPSWPLPSAPLGPSQQPRPSSSRAAHPSGPRLPVRPEPLTGGPYTSVASPTSARIVREPLPPFDPSPRASRGWPRPIKALPRAPRPPSEP